MVLWVSILILGKCTSAVSKCYLEAFVEAVSNR